MQPIGLSPPGVVVAALIVARKDLLIELRTRSAIFAATVFSMIGLSIFYFVWDPGEVTALSVAPGILWVLFAFSGLLGVQRSFALEQTERALDGLLMSPIAREAVYVGKMLANVVFVGAIQLVSIPVLALFYNIPIAGAFATIVLVALLATIGLAAVGTLFGAMAANTRMAELLLPLLSLPFFMPIVMTASRITVGALNGFPLVDSWPFVRLLIGFDVVFVTACTLAYPYTIEE